MKSLGTRTKPTSVSFPIIKFLSLVPSSNNFNRTASPDQLKLEELSPANTHHGLSAVSFVKNVMAENVKYLKTYKESRRATTYQRHFTQKSGIFTKICQILASTGIHYSDCDHTALKEQKMLEKSSAKWNNEHKNSIKWKQINEDKGCTFYLKADRTSLKIATKPQGDGTIDISYYTKHTLGKYCPKHENEKEASLFYDSLLEDQKPSEISLFVIPKYFLILH
ncbi:hypothetical protein INT46_010279 [Mucor plumbeus]|uniref:Uncharacterized protein n=1 Tax=Mucor plumbeus TaxID=97098 RepID=A0A8H7R4N2_9FUNG|nr:hypothetical protein INT46_010279 [Mucor plumbeus]